MTGITDRNLLNQFYAFLSEKGFAQYQHIEEVDHFGDSLTEFRNLMISMRVITDRGQLHIDVSAMGSSKWFELSDVLHFLDYKNGIVSNEDQSQRELIERFIEQYDQVVNVLSSWWNRVCIRLYQSRK